MTNEKRETAIKWLQNEIRSLRLAPTINGCGPENWADLLEIMETCLETVRGHGNKPLTLEQLRKMDGQPVWIMESPNWGHWELSEDAEDYLCDRDTDLYGLTYPDPDGKGGLHKLGWIAYAYPPAHIDRGAWTAEWRELHGDKMVGLDDCGDDVYRYYHYSVCTSCGKGSAVKSNFCPVCGKAMTPESWDMLKKRLRGW